MARALILCSFPDEPKVSARAVVLRVPWYLSPAYRAGSRFLANDIV